MKSIVKILTNFDIKMCKYLLKPNFSLYLIPDPKCRLQKLITEIVNW